MAFQTLIGEGAFHADLKNKINSNFALCPELVAAPSAANSAGTAGQMAYASGVLYVCVAANTWQKVTIATW